MRQSSAAEWTAVNEAVQTEEPFSKKRVKGRRIRGPCKCQETIKHVIYSIQQCISLESPGILTLR